MGRPRKDVEVKSNIENSEIKPEMGNISVSSDNVAPIVVRGTEGQFKGEISDIRNLITNLDSRIGEIEGYRNPQALDNRVRVIQENIDSLDTRLQKVEALLKKAYALGDEELSEVVRLKGNPGTAA